MPSPARPSRWRNILLMLVILPFWTSFLLRVYALDRVPARRRRHQQHALGVFGQGRSR
jgi:ABC-type spermidine/putrescine transport system permease subunit I